MTYVTIGTKKNDPNELPERPVTEDYPPISTTGGEARVIEPSGTSKSCTLKGRFQLDWSRFKPGYPVRRSQGVKEAC